MLNNLFAVVKKQNHKKNIKNKKSKSFYNLSYFTIKSIKIESTNYKSVLQCTCFIQDIFTMFCLYFI